MNKIIMRAAFAAAVACAGMLAACSGQAEQAGQAAAAGSQEVAVAETHQIVCATFPAYDWTMQILGDRAENFDVTYLMDSGVDLHSYQATVEDIAKIADADLFVYVGGESDEWAFDAVEAAANDDLHTVNMLEAVGDAAVEEEVVEGMQAEEEEEEEGEEEGPEYDEHVWLSLRNAQLLVDEICNELSEVDPEGAEVYAANAEAYKAQLADLDARYASAVEATPGHTVIFADRFPFRYLAEDYDLTYYAAFVGCSAETEASFETIAFLADKVTELGASTVLVIENSDQKIAETVLSTAENNAGQILVMDSLQSVTFDDVGAGKTYLSTMEANLAILEAALV